jgi:RNA methyltransferase, TrmH family
VTVADAKRLVRRTARDDHRAFLAEGPQAVREALLSGRTGRPIVRQVFATDEARRRHHDIVALAGGSGVPVQQVAVAGVAGIAGLTGTITPQGLVAVCDFVDVSMDQIMSAEPALVVVLAEVRDPGNAGTVIRTADAAGVGAVVFTDRSVDVYNGKCVRATAGSLFHVPITVGADIAGTVARLRDSGIQVLAADGAGESDLDQAEASGWLAVPTAWLFGNEAWGLPEDVRRLADRTVRVPIHGRAESLNLAAAAAVCLYASARVMRHG